MRTIRFLLLTLVLWMVCRPAGYAQQGAVYSNSLRGDSGEIRVGAVLLTSDLTYQALSGLIDTTYRIDNRLSLRLDEENRSLVMDSFWYRVGVRVYRTDASGRLDSTDAFLQVNYRRDSGQYKPIDLLPFAGNVNVRVVVRSLDSSRAMAGGLARFLRLENTIAPVRSLAFDCHRPITSLRSLGVQNGEWGIAWNDPVNGQTEYDVEWSWVDQSAAAAFNNNLPLLFENNASRITIEKLTCTIPLLYDGDGWLLVRVRPAQVRPGGVRYEGDWSYYTDSGAPLMLLYTGHENGLNWQASTSYAEEGKRKSVVQYYDGTLRSRQTVTKDNTTGKTVVAESMYDYQGRAVIQVLPAPTISTIIGYTRQFNQFTDAGVSKAAYDKVIANQTICTPSFHPMDSASGAARYYSMLNDDVPQGGNTLYLPHGEGFVFAETRYTSDGTGRVQAQGGVGKTFQIGSGHETRYFYDTPTQPELDGLFGTDAGEASHYSRTWLRDANGQYSVTYTDMKGHTVATALAGPVPTNLAPLPSFAAAAKTIERPLLTAENNVVRGRSIVSSQPLIVPEQNDYTFKYNFSPENLVLNSCQDLPICYTCRYDLKITIVPDCPENAVANMPVLKDNISLGGFSTTCTNQGFDFTFMRHLQEGSYTVIKELTLRQDAQDYYRDQFLVTNTCRQLSDFLQEQYNLALAQQNCNPTCASCSASLGSYTEFRDKFLHDANITDATLIQTIEPQIQTAFQTAQENCRRLCNGTATDDGLDEVRNIRALMLRDMTPPNGQYAHLNEATAPYNLFRTSTSPLFGPANAWRRPRDPNGAYSTAYNDEFGAPVQPYSQQVIGGTSTPQAFSDGFRASFAGQLISYHPEYCRLRRAEVDLATSWKYAADLRKIDRWDDAVAAGYIVPGGNASSPGLLVANDPFYQIPAVISAGYRAQIYTALFTRYPITSGANASIWHIAQAGVLCQYLSNATHAVNDASIQGCFGSYPNNMPASATSAGWCVADRNQVWRTVRDLYLSQRRIHLNSYLDQAPCSLPTQAMLAQWGYVPRFPNSTVVSSTNMGGEDYINNIINNGNDPNNANQFNNGVMPGEADSVCRSFADQWIAKLLECPAVANFATSSGSAWAGIRATLVDKLVGICKPGVSYMDHPYGASSLPPSAPSVNGFRNFPAVIVDFLLNTVHLASLDDVCNGYMIEFPAAYEAAPALVNQTVYTRPSACDCERIHTLQQQWQTSGYGGTFSAWLGVYHATTISETDIQKLLALCVPNSPGCNFQDPPVKLPPALQCKGQANPKTCIDCNDYQALVTAFHTETGLTNVPYAQPQTPGEVADNQYFARYANYRTGFAKTWSDYVAFGLQCPTGPDYSCGSLTAALNAFYQSPEYLSNPEGASCEAAFTTFMNNWFHQQLAFTEWINLFTQNCGSAPGVCKPRITCERLKAAIDAFYAQYGYNIYLNVNVRALFATFVSGQLQQNLSYDQIDEQYTRQCGGCGLQIDRFPNCYLLTKVYDAYRGWMATQPPPPSTFLCQEQFAAYVNNYFHLPAGSWDWPHILDAFNECYVRGCGPSLDHLCDAPYSCKELQEVLNGFYHEYGDAIGADPNCVNAFVTYFNHHFGTNLTMAQIQALFLQYCGKPIEVCHPEISCEDLNNLMQQFAADPTSDVDCQAQFVAFFNAHFGTAYTWDEIQARYEKCGIRLDVCTPLDVDCKRLQEVLAQFHQEHPDPVGEYGTDCQQAFVNYFNNYLGTNATWAQIVAAYQACKITLNPCEPPALDIPCEELQAALIKFKDKYPNPYEQLGTDCQQAFVDFFNNYFGTHATWAQIVAAYQACKIPLDVCDPPALDVDCDRLQALLVKFHEQHPNPSEEFGAHCQDAFVEFFNGQLGLNATWAQIVAAYQRCGITLNVCDQPALDIPCAELQAALIKFKDKYPNPVEQFGANCQQAFVDYFNSYFGTHATWAQIAAAYQGCGIALDVCGTASPELDCREMNQVLFQFINRPYNPAERDCQSSFQAYFNSAFHTSLSYDEIINLYRTHCDKVAVPCPVRVHGLYFDVVESFHARYGQLHLPPLARRDFFGWYFHQEQPQVEFENFDQLYELLQHDGTYPQWLDTDFLVYTPSDPLALSDLKQAYYIMHGTELVPDCGQQFAEWCNHSFEVGNEYEEWRRLYDATDGSGGWISCDGHRTAVVPGAIVDATQRVRAPLQPRGMETTTANPGPLLCGEPLFDGVPIEPHDPCPDPHVLVLTVAEEKYQLYREELRGTFDAAYQQKCLAAGRLEKFTVSATQAEHHYTLYYYDQAGQLVKTVPPEGVDDRRGDATFLAQVAVARAAVKAGTVTPSVANQVVPNHGLLTEYRYNTLAHVVEQQSPDAGKSNYWFDVLGRLVVSQNAKQAHDGKYSYTLFDAIGRITEIGVLAQGGMTQTISRSPQLLNSWLIGKPAEQVTRTGYDVNYFDGQGTVGTVIQQHNLRNNVSYTALYPSTSVGQAQTSLGLHSSATYFSYDLHNSIECTVQDYNNSSMVSSGNRFKRIDYDYDLISGAVKTISYQRGSADQFYYRYTYDAENRATQMETSADGVSWEQDLRYSFYKHGPVARMELGQLNAQGIDFAYTLQGWIKGLNSSSVGDGRFDMGHDGDPLSGNRWVARDVVGLSLSYFQGDYTGLSRSSFAETPSSLPSLSDGVFVGKELFNGNIRSMLLNLPAVGDARLYGYRYDQMSRLVAMNTFGGINNASNTLTPSVLQESRERVAYDANGNIQSYSRNAGSGATQIDDLTYYYYYYTMNGTRKQWLPSTTRPTDFARGTNQLAKVEDRITTNTGTQDIKNQTDENYDYDLIGNLIQDKKDGIKNVVWDAYGKIQSFDKEVAQSAGSVSLVSTTYGYDASGNRIFKSVNGTETWYVRDAQGSLLAVYERANAGAPMIESEVSIGVSNRVGTWMRNKNVTPLVSAPASEPMLRGTKRYDISNHVDNVLVTISDRKLGQDVNGDGIIDYYLADVQSAQDYYPFGMIISERSVGATGRRTINGQERTPEVGANTTSAEFWQYDARIARRWNLDPKPNVSISSYAVFGNNPIWFSDSRGDSIDPKRTKPKNFIVVASKTLRDEDIREHGGKKLNSALYMDYKKAKRMERRSHGQMKVVEADNAADAVSQIKQALGPDEYVANLTIDFHRSSGPFDDPQFNDPKDIKAAFRDLANGYIGKESNVYLGMCWSGGNSQIGNSNTESQVMDNLTARASEWLDGATTYGHNAANSSVGFWFTNQFKGYIGEDYAKTPENKAGKGIHTVTYYSPAESRLRSVEIKVKVFIRNTGEIHIKKPVGPLDNLPEVVPVGPPPKINIPLPSLSAPGGIPGGG